MLLLSNTACQHATLSSIVSFVCVGIDYAGSREELEFGDWRQFEDLCDRIRNCGESGGHIDSDAYS